MFGRKERPRGKRIGLQENLDLKGIEGEARTGTKLDVRLQPPGARGITLHPRVLSAVPGRELTWLGHLLVPGIFDGEHRFLIHEGDGNTVTFVQEELFK